MLAGHGIICWGDTSKACYDNTIALIADAAAYLNERLARGPAFGGQVVAPLPAERARCCRPADAQAARADGRRARQGRPFLRRRRSAGVHRQP
jgi:rhamnose utilization protein RhaD (predicted bifunctional aldolase and dehydrogenase)